MWKQHARARSGESVSPSDSSDSSGPDPYPKGGSSAKMQKFHLPADADLDEYAHVRAPRRRSLQPALQGSQSSSFSRPGSHPGHAALSWGRCEYWACVAWRVIPEISTWLCF